MGGGGGTGEGVMMLIRTNPQVTCRPRNSCNRLLCEVRAFSCSTYTAKQNEQQNSQKASRVTGHAAIPFTKWGGNTSVGTASDRNTKAQY